MTVAVSVVCDTPRINSGAQSPRVMAGPQTYQRRSRFPAQSIYIALLILIGDAAGYIPTVHAQAHLQTPLPAGFMHAVYSYALPVHALYA